MPSRSVSAPPMRSTNDSPSTSTLKLWFVMPPLSAVTRAGRPGHRRSTASQGVMYESYVKLAQRLSELAPGDGPKKAIFFSTGAEAVENAVKIARAHTGRPAVISFRGSFHGRTLLALSLTGSVQPYKQNF